MLGKPQYVSVSTLAILSALLLIAVRSAPAQTETVLYNFCAHGEPCLSGDDARSSLASDGQGNFFGTTILGGDNYPEACGLGCGVVFELSPDGQGGWNETVLYNFCSVSSPVFCADGYEPLGPVIEVSGNLYGTTSLGGLNQDGVVFELSPGDGGWRETILYNFGGTSGGPRSGLIMDKAGNLYGTAPGGEGSVFELSPDGNGGWTEQVIYSAPMDTAGLVMDSSGNIYGVDFKQHVFELTPNGKGGWNATNILTFNGANPQSTPVLDSAGNLYGTTDVGGSTGRGTLWELSPGKKGWKEKVLHTFTGTKNGFDPVGGLVLDSAGNIYGTTMGGGKDENGIVFELAAPVGKGARTEKVLWNFNITDGALPNSSLVLDSAGNLYGTASGGSTGGGVVFEVTP
jgi:uncharacterized repeat protein (TIGR03803 family)